MVLFLLSSADEQSRNPLTWDGATVLRSVLTLGAVFVGGFAILFLVGFLWERHSTELARRQRDAEQRRLANRSPEQREADRKAVRERPWSEVQEVTDRRRGPYPW